MCGRAVTCGIPRAEDQEDAVAVQDRVTIAELPSVGVSDDDLGERDLYDRLPGAGAGDEGDVTVACAWLDGAAANTSPMTSPVCGCRHSAR